MIGDTPQQGLNRKTYRSTKFGSWEKSQVLDAQIHDVGAVVIFNFHDDRMAMTPNTAGLFNPASMRFA